MTVEESVKSKLKQLKIQTGIVQRLNKEIRYYMKEEAALLEKFENLKAANAPEARQAGECYSDVKKVAPQVLVQLASAHKDLFVTLEREFADVDVSNAEDSVAKEVLQARTQMEKTAEVIPDIHQRSLKHLEMIEKGDESSGSGGNLLCY